MPESPGPRPVRLSLHYELSGEQKALSQRIVENFQNGTDTLVYAVCGAGKTELSYGVIAYAVSKGMNVGFAVPRRDVAIELYWRIKEAFSSNKVVVVYGQHTSCLTGDIVILTTHQLYRYPNCFDLLVMDEIDAFPFKGNDVLISMFRKSLRGHCVMMSATPSDEIKKEFSKKGREILELRTRFHKHEIPVPQFKGMPRIAQYPFIIVKLLKYRKEKKPCLVFAPTISKAEELYSVIGKVVNKGGCVHSKKEDRPELIESFKKRKLDYLITTSVLERGVTIKDLQVIVSYADESRIYDSAALIQIAGRAGRKSDAPTGDVLFLGVKENEEIQKSIDEIKYCNTFL